MQGFADIPANPVDDRGGDGPASCVLGHDVAPDRAVGAPAVIDHHHVAGGYVINKVAHCSRRNTGRNVLHGECRPHNHLGVVGQGGDAQALAGQAEFIQGIRDAWSVQPFKQGDQLLIIHCACSVLMASNWLSCMTSATERPARTASTMAFWRRVMRSPIVTTCSMAA